MNDPGVFYGFFITYSLLAIALYVWIGFSLSAVFAKAGEERFKAWVPVWNIIVLLQLGGLSGWLVLMALVPFLGQLALLVALIVAYHRINRSFGFGAGMTVLAVLLFPVWSSIVGWGSARWIGWAHAPGGSERRASDVRSRRGDEPPAGPMRRGDAAMSLDTRVGAVAQPGYGVPPRPPVPGFAAPVGTVPTMPAAPAFAGPAFAPPAPVTPVPAPGAYAPPPAPPLATNPPAAYASPASAIPPMPPAPPALMQPTPAPVAPAPVPAAPFVPAPGAPYAPASSPEVEGDDADDTPTPAFRSSARAAAAAAAARSGSEDAAHGDGDIVEQDEADILPGRSQAPFTQTVPTTFVPPVDEASLPAAPRRAFTPTAGEAPPPVNPFAAAAAPEGVIAPEADGSVPVQGVPAPPEPEDAADTWAPPASTGPMPAVAARATRYSPPPDIDAQFDTSAEISAVAGAPTLGSPRSARESVSAQHAVPEIPDNESAFDETILAVRHRPAWMLFPPLGAPVAVTSEVLIIGRRPGTDADFPDAQLVPVSDETRTMSKTHARLERQNDAWTIVDLYSTNGVILVGDDGAERDAVPGLPERLSERFLLGDAELRLSKRDA